VFTLRPYQAEAVEATLKHFRQEKSPAVIVLPTGAGKSLVIAELARLARGRVLVVAHVRELVEQNHAKFLSFDLEAGIYSAGLNRKEISQKVIFGSIQSIARAPDEFFTNFSLVVIDECHRVSIDGDTQYLQVISKLQEQNPDLCVLGLTATPYRLGLGWIYEEHVRKKLWRTKEERFFKKCIYELSIGFMIKNGYLTQPIKIDSPVACYDFSSLKLERGRFVHAQVEEMLKDQKRITPMIIKNIVDMSEDRKGVMIFTSSINHAIEIMKSLPPFVAALVTGDTGSDDREEIIQAFKDQRLKFLVNVSVLTTGFDAPHVDVIAILRPTESVSLYQQIVGRGLRLSPGKQDCLILDYTGQDHDLYSPVIDEDKPTSDSVPVGVLCPQCGTENHFWGLVDEEGILVEHFGRKCQAIIEGEDCGFRFRYKLCDSCGAENDIAARTCSACQHILVDNDKKLKEAMSLKDAHVMRVDSMVLQASMDKKGHTRLEVDYYDADAEVLKEYFYLDSSENKRAFYFNYVRMHLKIPQKDFVSVDVEGALRMRDKFRAPMFVIARKAKHYWTVREKIFN
jgi:DNA repair protein RadD